MAKHALNGFYDSVRAELLHQGSAVNVTLVHMPAMNTPVPHRPGQRRMAIAQAECPNEVEGG